MSEGEYKDYISRYDAAASLLKGRKKQIEKVWATMECNFSLIGATAIEDKLQDKVPETIHYLLEARGRN
jgi:phospholipid-transporting ATPase